MTITLADLRTAVRRMADMEGSTFVTDAEVNDYINRGAAHWHSILSQRYEDYFITNAILTIATGNTLTLPVDFHKLRGVDFQADSVGNDFRTMSEFAFNARNSFSPAARVLWGQVQERRYRIMRDSIWIVPETLGPGTYRLWYTTLYKPMVLDGDTIADWQGWHELIITEAAIKCLRKQESETNDLRMEQQAIEERIRAGASNRNAGDPPTVQDVQIGGRYGYGRGWWRG